MLVTFSLLLDTLKIDLWLAEWMYQLQGQQWTLRNHYITETLLHSGARKLLVLFALAVLILAIASLRVKPLKHLKHTFWFLFLCFISAPALVALLKGLTHMDCPWDINLFGGQYPYLHLLQTHPHTWRYGECFPGGHSSGGFSLIALYFVFQQIKPAWRYHGLIIGLATGGVFGAVQEFRGAHFLSHDLWSLAICWAVCLVYSPLLRNGKSYVKLNPLS